MTADAHKPDAALGDETPREPLGRAEQLGDLADRQQPLNRAVLHAWSSRRPPGCRKIAGAVLGFSPGFGEGGLPSGAVGEDVQEPLLAACGRDRRG